MKVFISHSSSDKAFVRKLKEDLNLNSIETFVDEDSLELGDSLTDKLEDAIDESSHFLIVLSDHAVNSKWVQFELKEALQRVGKKTIAKVIPIKYRPCEMPPALANLIFSDLSAEIIKIEHAQIHFLTPGYDQLLLQLIKTIKSSERALNDADKKAIKKENRRIEKGVESEFSNQLIINHRIAGFSDLETLNKYIKKVSAVLPPHGPTDIFPIRLPGMYEALLKPIAVGSKIRITGKGGSVTCRLAGFRPSQTHIVIQNKVREKLNLRLKEEYAFHVDLKNASFTIVG